MYSIKITTYEILTEFAKYRRCCAHFKLVTQSICNVTSTNFTNTFGTLLYLSFECKNCINSDICIIWVEKYVGKKTSKDWKKYSKWLYSLYCWVEKDLHQSVEKMFAGSVGIVLLSSPKWCTIRCLAAWPVSSSPHRNAKFHEFQSFPDRLSVETAPCTKRGIYLSLCNFKDKQSQEHRSDNTIRSACIPYIFIYLLPVCSKSTRIVETQHHFFRHFALRLCYALFFPFDPIGLQILETKILHSKFFHY